MESTRRILTPWDFQGRSPWLCLVAQQEIDDSQAKDLEFEAQVSSSSAALSAAQQQLQMAEANQKQYSALSDYSRIVAPFAGVVTSRYADTGALIAAPRWLGQSLVICSFLSS